MNLLADMTGIPMQSISSDESQKLANLESTLHKRYWSRRSDFSNCKSYSTFSFGIQNPIDPIASFMFCGPTGVGKTEVTKALAVSMFGVKRYAFVSICLNLWKRLSSRLIGSPPGYVGYDDGGQLNRGCSPQTLFSCFI